MQSAPTDIDQIEVLQDLFDVLLVEHQLSREEEFNAGNNSEGNLDQNIEEILLPEEIVVDPDHRQRTFKPLFH